MNTAKWSVDIMVSGVGEWLKRQRVAEYLSTPAHSYMPAILTNCRCIGWAFTGQGKCTKIPQGGDPANPRSCAVAYPCVVRQDLLWIKLVPLSSGAAVDTGDIPIIPEIDVSLITIPRPTQSSTAGSISASG